MIIEVYKVIYLRISNGLGNQMFQYAFGRQIQEIYHMPLVLETFRYHDFVEVLRPLRTEEKRYFLLNRLSIPFGNVAEGGYGCIVAKGLQNAIITGRSFVKRHWAEKIRKIPQTGADGYARMIKLGMYATNDIVSYYPFERTNAKHIILHGWFMSEKYFHDIAPTIKQELRVKEVSSDAVRRLAAQMLQENSVCVHVRRGDYIGHSRFDVCTEDYFRRAVEYVRERVAHPVFYVFSNNPAELDWIKENYAFLEGAHFVKEGVDELDDLYLMYHCRHHIISNSTFSWWGSYLKLQEGMTICPERWLNDDMQQDILLEDWIPLPV